MEKTCFVVCPIGNENSDTRIHSDKLLNRIIAPACKEKDFKPIRVDQLNFIDKIDDTIIDFLNNADLVIADLTFHNPNVFFEVGYRFALKKPCILLNKNGSTLPFDLVTTRTIFFDFDVDNVEKIVLTLANTIDNIDFSKFYYDEDTNNRREKMWKVIESHLDPHQRVAWFGVE